VLCSEGEAVSLLCLCYDSQDWLADSAGADSLFSLFPSVLCGNKQAVKEKGQTGRKGKMAVARRTTPIRFYMH